jgi:hypothetical protein
MPTAGMAAALKHVEEANEIGLTVALRLDERIANPGLGSEVNDVGKTIRGKQRRHRGAIGDIKLFETEPPQIFEFPEPRSFEANVVIAAQVVETDHRSTLLKQATRDMKPDETGGSRHQNGFVIRHGTDGTWMTRSIASGRHKHSHGDEMPCQPARAQLLARRALQVVSDRPRGLLCMVAASKKRSAHSADTAIG